METRARSLHQDPKEKQDPTEEDGAQKEGVRGKAKKGPADKKEGRTRRVPTL